MKKDLLNSSGTSVGSMVGIEVGRIYSGIGVGSLVPVAIGVGIGVNVAVAVLVGDGVREGVAVTSCPHAEARKDNMTKKLALKRFFILAHFPL
jgi:hypothetical protein